MNISTKQALISQIGETDQRFLQENTAELALKRGQLRLQLIDFSQQDGEKIYFLQQAIAILEQARLSCVDVSQALFVDLSITLAQSYLYYFQITQQRHYALIVEQIIKPLSHLQHIQIYQLLQQSAEAQQHKAMATYWQKKLEKLT